MSWRLGDKKHFLFINYKGIEKRKITANKHDDSSSVEWIFHTLMSGSKKNVRAADRKVENTHIHIDNDKGSR